MFSASCQTQLQQRAGLILAQDSTGLCRLLGQLLQTLKTLPGAAGGTARPGADQPPLTHNHQYIYNPADLPEGSIPAAGARIRLTSEECLVTFLAHAGSHSFKSATKWLKSVKTCPNNLGNNSESLDWHQTRQERQVGYLSIWSSTPRPVEGPISSIRPGHIPKDL